MTKKHKDPTIADIVEQFKKSEGMNTKKKKKVANQWLIDSIQKLKDKKDNNNV